MVYLTDSASGRQLELDSRAAINLLTDIDVCPESNRPKWPRAAKPWLERGGWYASAQRFPDQIPRRPYCADYVKEGLIVRARERALEFRHVQPNSPNLINWIVLDLDHCDSALTWEEANVPPPNIIVVNPANGHAHYFYLLENPVWKHDSASQKAHYYYDAVRRGLTRRLRADQAYGGLIAKNPLHRDWRTIWGRSKPYSLLELDRWLEPADKAPIKAITVEFGFGRNSSLFNAVRKSMYSRVLAVKAAGGTHETFLRIVTGACEQANQQFSRPLGDREIKSIAKSIAKWIWRRFDAETFSRIQSARAHKRWKGREKSKPWLAYGLSERTYWRRKAKDTLPVLET